MAVTGVVVLFECPLLEVGGPKSTIGIPLELTNRTVASANTIRPASAGIPGTSRPRPVIVTTASLPGVVPFGYSNRNTDENGNANDLPVADELRITCVPGWVSSSRMIAPDWSSKTLALSVPTWVIETLKPQADVRSGDGAVLSIGIEIWVGAAAAGASGSARTMSPMTSPMVASGTGQRDRHAAGDPHGRALQTC